MLYRLSYKAINIGIPFISPTDSDGIAEAWGLFIPNTADDWWGFKDHSPLL